MLAVVSDSSPIIYLTRLDLFSLLSKLHDRVVVPPAVWREVVIGGAGLPESDCLLRAVADGWIEVKTPASPANLLGSSVPRLGPGEIEAILLAKEWDAILLTDDGDARVSAESLGLRVTGTIGLLVRAKTAGFLSELRPVLDRLRETTTFHISENLYQKALKQSGEA